MMNISWVQNLKKPIAIVGLGKSGKAALAFLKKIGFNDSDLITFDEKDSSAQIHKFTDLIKSNPNTLVVSPGVPLKTPALQKMIEDGAFLTSEIALAASVLTTEKLIGITGSVGKSTVTSLLGEAALVADENAFIGGNLGLPFCEYATAILNNRKKAQWIV